MKTDSQVFRFQLFNHISPQMRWFNSQMWNDNLPFDRSYMISVVLNVLERLFRIKDLNCFSRGHKSRFIWYCFIQIVKFENVDIFEDWNLKPYGKRMHLMATTTLQSQNPFRHKNTENKLVKASKKRSNNGIWLPSWKLRQ